VVARPISRRAELLTPAQARRLFAYNWAVFDRHVRYVRRLSLREARRNREIGHQSYFNTLVHILNVHEVWIGYILQHRDTDPELEKLFEDASRHPTDWAGFRTYANRVWTLIDGYLARLTPRELARPVHAFWMSGRYTASDALWQTTFEEAHHIGEIIGALWQQNREGPGMTWLDVGRGLAARRS
jgi:uncharacterized damage-inducible protein DinB